MKFTEKILWILEVLFYDKLIELIKYLHINITLPLERYPDKENCHPSGICELLSLIKLLPDNFGEEIMKKPKNKVCIARKEILHQAVKEVTWNRS